LREAQDGGKVWSSLWRAQNEW